MELTVSESLNPPATSPVGKAIFPHQGFIPPWLDSIPVETVGMACSEEKEDDRLLYNKSKSVIVLNHLVYIF